MGELINLNSDDPYPIYLTQSEADTRYQLPVTIVQQQVSSPAQMSILANTWFDLGTLPNVNSGNAESLWAASFYLQYIVNGQTFPYWQYSGALLLSPVWWKAGGTQLEKKIDMECHNNSDFTLGFKLGLTQANRMVQLYFPISLSAKLIRASFVKLRF